MPDIETAEIIRRFNNAFLDHDADALDDLVGEDCVMEAIQPAPDGARYKGRDACLAFWQALVNDRGTQFEPEEVTVAGDRATIRWRYRYGPGDADYVRGVNLMRVRDGAIVEALGYSKTPGDQAVPLAVDDIDATASAQVE
jgi:ketosteroid isomerase-like protein